jgi:hypothetical protein
MSGDAAWLAWRAGGWGASDIAAAWCNRYGGAYRVVAAKAGLLDDEADEETDEQRRGHELEPTLGAMVQLATGWWVVGAQTWCEHRDDDRWRCTVDGFAMQQPDEPLHLAEAVVEFKTHGVNVRAPWDYYEAQVQWQLMVTDLDLGVLAVATVDDELDRIVDFRLRLVEVDVLMRAALVELAEQLDEHLRAGTLPAPDGSDLATAAVKQLTWVESPLDGIVDLSDIEAKVERADELRTLIAEAKAEQAELENVLRDRIGVFARGVAGDLTVSYSKPRRVLDEARVLDEYPALGKVVLDREAAEAQLGKAALDEYREPIGARTLTIKRAKERAA